MVIDCNTAKKRNNAERSARQEGQQTESVEIIKNHAIVEKAGI